MALSNMEAKRLWELEIMTAAGRQEVAGEAILGSVSVSPHPDNPDLVRVRWESMTTMPREAYDAIRNQREGNLKTSPVKLHPVQSYDMNDYSPDSPHYGKPHEDCCK